MQQTIEIVQKAFESGKYPGDNNIISADTIRDNETDECEAKFKGKKWEDIEWSTISNEGYASSAFLSNDAFRYYLPAYMVSIVSHFTEMADARDVIVSRLTLPQIGDFKGAEQWGKRFYDRMEGLTIEQKHAVRVFLEWLHQTHPEEFLHQEPETAVKRYWGKF